MNNFLDEMKQSVLARIETHDFLTIFKQDRCSIIAEIKFASPSAGTLYHGTLDHVAIAAAYLANGAHALSILTEPRYFKGDIEYIKAVRQAFPQAMILLKDFVCHRVQIQQALHYGANAVLLIVAFLNTEQLHDLYHYTLHLGLTPVIEVHSPDELAIAINLHPRVISINNRNLKTLEVNVDTAKDLIKFIPDEIYTLCASGVKTSKQIHEMSSLGFDGLLIGTELMSHDDPGIALQQLLTGDHHES